MTAPMSDTTQDALDPVAETILTLVAGTEKGKSISPEDAARAFAETRRKKGDPPDLWRRYLPAVRQQALHLARSGRIAMLRRGEPVDPDKPVKGVVRLSHARKKKKKKAQPPDAADP